MFVLLLSACAFRAPPEPPPLSAAQAGVTMMPIGGDHVLATVRAGSAYDPVGREGLAMVTAFAVAGSVEAWLIFGPDTVSFAVAAADAPALAAALAAPVTDARVQTGREAVEVGRGHATCPDIAEAAWDTWIYAGHPYGHAAIGRISVVPTLTGGDARALQAQRYVRGGLVVGLPPAASAGAAFDALAPALSSPATPTTYSPPVGAPVLVIEAPVGAACAVAGHPTTLAMTDAARAAHALFRVASTDAPPDPVRREPRLLTRIDLSADPDPSILRELDADLARLDTAGLSDDAFTRARTRALAGLDDLHVADEVLSRRLVGLPDAPSLRGVLEAATRADVNAALTAAIDLPALRLVIVTPNASAFRTESGAVSGVQAVMSYEELTR